MFYEEFVLKLTSISFAQKQTAVNASLFLMIIIMIIEIITVIIIIIIIIIGILGKHLWSHVHTIIKENCYYKPTKPFLKTVAG